MFFFLYLEVGVGVGVGQPGRAGVFLVLEGSVEDLRYGTQIEGTHGGCGDAVSESQEAARRERKGHKMMDERYKQVLVRTRRPKR